MGTLSKSLVMNLEVTGKDRSGGRHCATWEGRGSLVTLRNLGWQGLLQGETKASAAPASTEDKDGEEAGQQLPPREFLPTLTACYRSGSAASRETRGSLGGVTALSFLKCGFKYVYRSCITVLRVRA